MEWTLYPFLALVLGEIAWVDYREHAIYDFDTLLAFALSGAAIRPFVLNLQRQKEFVTGASHELKTPIAVIQSNVEVLELTSGENKWTKNIRAQDTDGILSVTAILS